MADDDHPLPQPAAAAAEPVSGRGPARWRLYLELTKPKVVALIVFTAIVGTLLASPGWPPFAALVWGNLGIALAAGCAATINHVLDRKIDEQMSRTRGRPLPTGGLEAYHVIGGAAGAAPPVLGWAAVTNSIEPNALLLFLIIFIWTPPHFWALAIARKDEYARAGIPMLPVTHGVPYTRLQVLLYTVLLVLVTLMPWVTHMSGLVYLAAALVLNARFLYFAFALKFTDRAELPMQVFRYSISYLMWLFAALLLDHYIPTTQLPTPPLPGTGPQIYGP